MDCIAITSCSLYSICVIVICATQLPALSNMLTRIVLSALKLKLFEMLLKVHLWPGVAHTAHVPDNGEPLKLLVDIKFSEVPGSMPHYLDVTVTDSSAPSYRTYFNSATVAQAAARYREADKAKKYDHVIPEIGTNQNFHGFAV